MAGQVTIHPVKAEMTGDGRIRIEIQPNKTFGYRTEVVWLRPRVKDVNEVFKDLQARIGRGDKARIGDISGWGEREPYAFQYKEKVGGKRAAPDPDHAVLRHYERTHGCD